MQFGTNANANADSVRTGVRRGSDKASVVHLLRGAVDGGLTRLNILLSTE